MSDFLEKVTQEAERTFREDDMLRSYESWFLLLSEEVGEVAKAMNQDKPESEVMAELVQVGSLAKILHDILAFNEKRSTRSLADALRNL